MNEAGFLKTGAMLMAGIASAILGWYGWVLIVFAVCMVLDYVSGTAAAIKNGEWSSSKAREGIWHKVGTMLTVCAAILVDIVIGLCVNNMALPFDYKVLISPIVTVFYIVTEIGSVAENAGKLGVPVPKVLTKAIESLRKSVEEKEDKSE